MGIENSSATEEQQPSSSFIKTAKEMLLRFKRFVKEHPLDVVGWTAMVAAPIVASVFGPLNAIYGFLGSSAGWYIVIQYTELLPEAIKEGFPHWKLTEGLPTEGR